MTRESHISEPMDSVIATARTSRGRGRVTTTVLLGIILGAIAGSTISLAVPRLREWPPWGPRTFESEATVTVYPRYERDANVKLGPRECTFIGREVLETFALTLGSGRTAYAAMLEFKLEELQSFRGRSREDILQLIVDGVTVTRREDPRFPNANDIHLRFRGPVGEDCPKVVNAMIAVFREELLGFNQRTIRELQGVYSKIRNDTQSILARLNEQQRELKEGDREEAPMLMSHAALSDIQSLAARIGEQQTRLDDGIKQLKQVHDGYVVNTLKEPKAGRVVTMTPSAFLLLYGGIGAALGLLLSLPMANRRSR